MSRLNFAAAENLANDRLVSTLFLATLFHGMLILGISFNTGLFPESELAPTLEVVLVNTWSPSAEAADDAPYLALENSLGAGNTTARVTPASRAANPASADLSGEATASDALQQEKQVAQDPTLQLLVTRSLSAFSLVTLQEKKAEPEDRRLAQTSVEQHSPLSELYDETRIRDEQARERIVSVSTRESDIAAYLAAWKRKIEQVGTLNFPALERAAGARNPVLEVAVNADGHLRDIIVRRSSQVRAIDEAAVQILRLASPFDPFPAHMQDKYDVLRFVYEWQFIEGRRTVHRQPETDSEV